MPFFKHRASNFFSIQFNSEKNLVLLFKQRCNQTLRLLSKTMKYFTPAVLRFKVLYEVAKPYFHI